MDTEIPNKLARDELLGTNRRSLYVPAEGAANNPKFELSNEAPPTRGRNPGIAFVRGHDRRT